MGKGGESSKISTDPRIAKRVERLQTLPAAELRKWASAYGIKDSGNMEELLVTMVRMRMKILFVPSMTVA